MSNVGKASDGMLDTISELRRNRDNTKGWLEILQESHMLTPEVASILWESLMGIEGSEPNGDNLHRSESVR